MWFAITLTVQKNEYVLLGVYHISSDFSIFPLKFVPLTKLTSSGCSQTHPRFPGVENNLFSPAAGFSWIEATQMRLGVAA